MHSRARDDFLARFPSRTDAVLGAYTSLVWQATPEVMLTPGTEALEKSCSAYVCREEEVGPITIPSLGLEAAF